jgi:molybdopterin converting factor small subunit
MMKITVEFLSLPIVVKKVGSKSVVLDFAGTTVNDLVHEVAARYGSEVKKFLLDESGKLDMHLAVSLNQQDFIRQDQMNKPLHDGDRVTIMMLVAGG